MCFHKVEIKLKPNTDTSKLWKMPRQMISIYQKNGVPYMMAKCGWCDECRLEKVRNWTYKIFLESLSYNDNCFITLTYADNEKGKNLNKNDLVKFIKRLRKDKIKFKYFGAGEYGEKKGRAHYHIIILGWKPNDMRLFYGTKSKKGKIMFDSKYIKDKWGLGRITVQDFGKDEISYITLYNNKNNLIDKKYNSKEKNKLKKSLNELKVKYNLMIKTKSKSDNIIYTKIKLLKDLSKNELYNYKKNYIKLKEEYKPNKTPEFNIWSKGMGYQNFIKKEYYRYELIINNFKYETPKDFLMKAYENENNVTIKNHIVNKLLERKAHAEDNYIDTKNMEELKALRLNEQAKANRLKNQSRLNRTDESRTF